MDASERIKQVSETLDAFVQRTVVEYDITYGELIGILESIKLSYYLESRESADEAEED